MAVLTLITPVVLELDGERILECLPRLLEADAVLGEVRRRFALIPFELIILHDTTGCP